MNCLTGVKSLDYLQESYDKNLNYTQFENLLSNKQKTSNFSPLAIIDLDGTIFNNINRQIYIYKHYILPEFPIFHKFGLENKWCKLNYLPYSIMSTLKNLSPSLSIFKQVKSLFLKYFLSDKYLDLDTPFVFGEKILHYLYEQNYDLLFLTGRPFFKMITKTNYQLTNLIGNKIYSNPLIMKSKVSLSDKDHKISAISSLYSFHNFQNRFILFLDDNPEICNAISHLFPKILTINCKPYLFFEDQFSGFCVQPWL